MQTRKESLLEIIMNISTGMIVSWFITMYLFPVWFGLPLNSKQSWAIVCTYTVVSFIRSYTYRRIFNYLTIKSLQRGTK